jgi:hypothetical protein
MKRFPYVKLAGGTASTTETTVIQTLLKTYMPITPEPQG